MDKRTDDFIGEVEVRSDDSQEIKSFELFAHEFRVNDATGEIDFLDEESVTAYCASSGRDPAYRPSRNRSPGRAGTHRVGQGRSIEGRLQVA